ncbi:hypothetical protein CEXT_699251 [Caerostris extrusa]|uniref:Uncharacterized protein n=1 Tax=Caerostris extrusa TaxID=172846 RepID=A0AAV4QL81_CAEEX|nr:hypothetical protein CEXT_699251 [Caerostris extrusa]
MRQYVVHSTTASIRTRQQSTEHVPALRSPPNPPFLQHPRNGCPTTVTGAFVGKFQDTQKEQLNEVGMFNVDAITS